MPWAVVALAFLLTPIIEIYVIIQVGQAIGAWQTVALLIIESAIGAWLLKHEGRLAWRALNDALRTGRMPGRELADAALVLVGGTLLLTPGFVTDIFGFFCVLPFTRPLARRILSAVLARRIARGAVRVVAPGVSGPRGAPGWGGAGRQPGGQIVDGEVVEDDRPES
jgi:UPF0716 protein FxsA